MSVRASYSIGQLAAAAGVSRRTVHFYVQRKLVPPPAGLGRSAFYTDHHLAALLQIKGWQEQGVPLEEIRVRLSSAAEARAGSERRRSAPRSMPAAPREPADTPGTSWFRQPLVTGFELHVAGRRPPLTARQLATLARTLSEILENGEKR